jgi:hypothetical protein
LEKFLINADDERNELDCTTMKIIDIASVVIAAYTPSLIYSFFAFVSFLLFLLNRCIGSKKFTFDVMDVLFDPLIKLPNFSRSSYGLAPTALGKTIEHLISFLGSEKLCELSKNAPMELNRFLPKDNNDDEALNKFLQQYVCFPSKI